MPPTTTKASGFCTWLPMPVETAAGSNPIAAARQVITTGRRLFSDVTRRASSRDCPSFTAWLKVVTTRMPSITAMPNRATKPIAAEMEKAVPVKANASTPPMTASGMTENASSVSRNDEKLA